MTIQGNRQRKMRVRRPSQLPYALKRLVSEREQEPKALVAGVIERYPTFAEAADDLGVSIRTLRDWRKRLGIEVA